MLAHTRSLSVLLTASLMTGCAVGPRYKAPEIQLSAQFLGQQGVERREVQSKADLQRWWASFDDPALTRFVSLALEQNLELAQAAARVAQSRAASRVAGAALLPSGQVRDGRLLVTETAEVFVRRLDDLVSNRVIGGAARWRSRGGHGVHDETIPDRWPA